MNATAVPIWRLALAERKRVRRAQASALRLRLLGAPRRASALLALVTVLHRAGYAVQADTIVRRWSRARQGRAYLWAIAFLEGREDLPAPEFLARHRRRYKPRWTRP